MDSIKLGLIPNKKKKNVCIPRINRKLYKYFILGYFEGDGCITWSKNAYNLSFAGSNNICEGIKKIIYSELNIEGNIDVYDNITILKYRKIKHIIQIIKWLYTNYKFVLDRKYDKCKKLLYIFKNKGYKVPMI